LEKQDVHKFISTKFNPSDQDHFTNLALYLLFASLKLSSWQENLVDNVSNSV
jgi:hypothetical protein